MASKIEGELLDATNYDYGGNNTQEYLLGLLRAVEKLDDDTYDSLSDPACKWAKRAISAHNNHKPIPDFSDNDEGPNDDGSRLDTIEEVFEQVESPSEVVGDIKPVSPPPEPKRKGGRKKNPDKKHTKPAEAKVPDPVTGELVLPKDLMSLGKDKWGHVIGSKNSRAMELYEQGTTMRELTEKLGGKHYNVMRDAAKEGHHVEKDGTYIKVIHKDDYGKQAKGK